MIRRVFLVWVALLSGCDAGLCANRCEEREQQSTSACEQAASFFLEGQGSRLQPSEATISDFEGDSLTPVTWWIDCSCFSVPPELHIVREDQSGVTEIEQLTPAKLSDDGEVVSAELAADVVTPGSTWALQAVDADGRRTDPFCATVEIKGP